METSICRWLVHTPFRLIRSFPVLFSIKSFNLIGSNLIRSACTVDFMVLRKSLTGLRSFPVENN